MIYNVKGNLLTSDCTVIMHQANCFKTMGAGIAKSIAEMYPGAKQVDLDSPITPGGRFGYFTYFTADNDVTIANLYGQFNMGKGLQTDYEKLEKAMNLFLLTAKDRNVNLSKVGVPYKIGCGLAGGNWEIVRDIIERQSEKHEIDIYIYKFE